MVYGANAYASSFVRSVRCSLAYGQEVLVKGTIRVRDMSRAVVRFVDIWQTL